MSLQLAPPLKNRLIELLAAELSNATVFANYAISSWSLRRLSEIKSIPDKGELAEQLHHYIGENAFSTFVMAELDASFRGPGPDLNARDAPLATFQGYDDLGLVAADLVERFCTLPWVYRLTVRLPPVLGNAVTGEFDDIVLSPRHRIVSGARLRAVFPLADRPRGLAELMTNTRPALSWDDDCAYLQIEMRGYVQGNHTEPFFSARDDVLTFFGLGLALSLFEEKALTIDNTDVNTSHFCVHRSMDSGWIEHGAHEIEDQHQRGVRGLDLHPTVRGNPELMRKAIARIGTAFRSDAGKNIALSARWLFDSHCGRDALLKYVQAAVAIEILLGDEDVDPSVGLTTLMANRCAYLIAKTPSGRTNILKLFRQIYKVRSKIVHRGKSRLNAEEARLFHALLVILRMAIDSEQKLLERAEQVGMER